MLHDTALVDYDLRHIGHPDGSAYAWDDFLAKNPTYQWQKPFLRDLVDQPWTLFAAHERTVE